MEAKKWFIFSLLAVASASRNYETSGRNSWQGSNGYSSGLPSVDLARSPFGKWSNPGNSLGRSTISHGTDANGWSGIYRYGINKSTDSYSQQGWPNGRNLEGGYGDSQRNRNSWSDSSTKWNDVASRSNGGWNRPNAKSSSWQSLGW